MPSMAMTVGSLTSGFTTIVDIFVDNSGIVSMLALTLVFVILVGLRFPLDFLSSVDRCRFLFTILVASHFPSTPVKPAFLHSDMKVLIRGCCSGSTGTKRRLDMRCNCRLCYIVRQVLNLYS